MINKIIDKVNESKCVEERYIFDPEFNVIRGYNLTANVRTCYEIESFLTIKEVAKEWFGESGIKRNEDGSRCSIPGWEHHLTKLVLMTEKEMLEYYKENEG